MATVLSVSGSPSATSRTTRLLRHVDARLVDRGHHVIPFEARSLPAHVLAVDYALRPVLSSMGAGHITQGWFVLDRHITAAEDGTTLVECETDAQLVPVVGGFADALERLAAPVLTG